MSISKTHTQNRGFIHTLSARHPALSDRAMHMGSGVY